MDRRQFAAVILAVTAARAQSANGITTNSPMATVITTTVAGTTSTLTALDCALYSAYTAANDIPISDYQYVQSGVSHQQPNLISFTDGVCAIGPTPTLTNTQPFSEGNTGVAASTGTADLSPSLTTTVGVVGSVTATIDSPMATVITTTIAGTTSTLTALDCASYSAYTAANDIPISDYRYAQSGVAYQQPNYISFTDGNCAVLPTPTLTGTGVSGTSPLITTLSTTQGMASNGSMPSATTAVPYTGAAAMPTALGVMGAMLGAGVAAVGLL